MEGKEITIYGENYRLIELGGEPYVQPKEGFPIPLKLAFAEMARRKAEAENEEEVQRDLKLPPKELRNRISFDERKGFAPTIETLKRVRDGIRKERVPAKYWYVIWTKDGKEQIEYNSHGAFLKARLDPKILLDVVEEIVHEPTREEPWVVAKATLRYATGEFIGLRTRTVPKEHFEEGHERELTNFKQGTVTQAIGRASKKASPSAYTYLAEELLEQPGPPAKAPFDLEPKSLGDFYILCEQIGIKLVVKENKQKVCQILQVATLEDIPKQYTWLEAFELVKSKWSNQR